MLDHDESDGIKLYDSNSERETLDNLANLYSIILATEHLERAYARDAISQNEYTTECYKLITQFRLTEKVALGSNLTTETFMQIYQMDCPRAFRRLCEIGIPEQIKSSDNFDHKKVAVTVKETVEHFITAMDAVKLEQRAVDELQPILSELMDALTRLPDTPRDFEPSRIIGQWLQKLNIMRAVDNINEDDARQMLHDLDIAYTAFNRYLKRSE